MSALRRAYIKDNLFLSAAVIVCMLASVWISTRASERAIRSSERGQCESIQADVDAYLDEPPTTAAGWNQLRSKQARLRALGCPVPKK